jgi:hypothetical protein
MNNRREFVAGAVAAAAVPYILKKTVRAQTLRMRRDVQSLDPSDPWFASYNPAISVAGGTRRSSTSISVHMVPRISSTGTDTLLIISN